MTKSCVIRKGAWDGETDKGEHGSSSPRLPCVRPTGRETLVGMVLKTQTLTPVDAS